MSDLPPLYIPPYFVVGDLVTFHETEQALADGLTADPTATFRVVREPLRGRKPARYIIESLDGAERINTFPFMLRRA